MLQRDAIRRNGEVATTFSRTIHEERRSLIGWGAGLVATVLMELALFPTVRDNDMSKVVESYPESVKKLFALSDFGTGTGYVRAELFSLVVPIMFVILGILWGSDALAGEEERGTIDLLFANPISRQRLVLEKAAGVASGLIGIGALVFGVLLVGNASFGVGISILRLADVVAATLALAVLFATLALALGAATGRRGLARGVTAALAVTAYLLSSLASLVGWLRPWRVLSPWYHALGVDPLGNGASPVHLLVLAAGTALVLWAGARRFDRRDLGT